MDIKAYGKINLSLDVTGVLPNGYHSVSMVMQSVELCDIVSIEKNDSGKILVRCDNPQIPEGEGNLAYRACELVTKEFNIPCGFDIFIKKSIPVAGGMAGGSTDAAAVIRGINEICELNQTEEKLMKLGLALGADIPFCIQKKPALAEGIGEKLTQVSGLSKDLYILLVNPKVLISTKEIYSRIDNTKKYNSIDNQALVSALEGKDLKEAKANMKNVMQDVSAAICPEIDEIIKTLYEKGAEVALMSGSGATCYGVFKNKEDVIYAQSAFNNYFTAITNPVE